MRTNKGIVVQDGITEPIEFVVFHDRSGVYLSKYPEEKHEALILTKAMFDQIIEFYNKPPTPPELKLVSSK